MMLNTCRLQESVSAVLFLLLGSSLASPAQQAAPKAATHENEPAPYLLRLTTREVLIDVLATDRRDHPIRDQDRIEIDEVNEQGRRTPVEIASFRAVDAAQELAQAAPESGGFRLSLGGDCASRATYHYEISFHPDEEGWKSGYHEIEVRTNRPGVKLAYRHTYYVGARGKPDRLPTVAEAAAALQAAACYESAVPPSIGLSARPVATGLKDVVRFFATVDQDSLAFISVSSDHRRVQLDYGACTFDANGRPLRYFSSAADRMLTSQEYAQAVVNGLPNLLEFPRMREAAMMRVVVRDRTTGNVGRLDLALAAENSPDQAVSTADEQLVEAVALKQMKMQAQYNTYIRPPVGPIGSFGSILPKAHSFCGDVYDLPKNTMRLPNFWNLSSIGSLHTTSLDVPHQHFVDTGGIPGITANTAWLGIDYHAEFRVKKPGVYAFRLLVDDGADLYIDDQKVIDMDGVNSGRMGSGQIKLAEGAHSIHVPYIQGPPTDVGLVLAVKPPGKDDFQIFDVRDYSAPEEQVKSSEPK